MNMSQLDYVDQLLFSSDKVERKFLSNLLHSESVINALSSVLFDFLVPSHFKTPKCRSVYASVLKTYSEFGVLDQDRIKIDCGHEKFIDDLLYNNPEYRLKSDENLDLLGMEVVRNAERRELYDMVNRFAYSMNENTKIEDFQDVIFDFQAKWRRSNKNIVQFSTVIEEIRQSILQNEKLENLEFSCRWPKLAKQVKLCKKELLIISGDTSGGKTAFACNLSESLDRHGHKGAYILYEGTEKSIALRIVSDMTKISANSLRDTIGMSEKQKEAIVDFLGKLENNLVFQTSLPNIAALAQIIPYIKMNYNLDFIVIDHMHAMPMKGEIRTAVMETTRVFLEIAKKNDLLVIALAQLRKDSVGADKEPSADDLRESATIKQDAHHIWLLYDKGYYLDKDEYEEKSNALCQIQPPKAELIIAKNREGNAGISQKMDYIRETHSWNEV